MDLVPLWAAIAIWLWAFWASLGIWMTAKSTLEALSRNPEWEKKYMIYSILWMALAEATAIYAFVIAILALFTH